MKNISQESFMGIPVCRPPYKEQAQIARVLSTWDLRIEQIIRLVYASVERKKGLMLLLLAGKRRIKESDQDTWKLISLQHITHHSTLRNQGRLGIDAVMGVNKSLGMIPMKERIIGASLDRYKVVRHDWFAYNPMRLNIGSLARWQGTEDALVSPDYVVFHCDPERLDPDFFDHFRRSRLWERYVQSAGNGSVRVRIYFDDLARMTIKLPPLDEQRRIAAVLNAADRAIRCLQRLLNLLREQRNGLMQNLLTGRLRVKEARP